KAVTQLFGDRLLIANATGCSSIYGGNLPTSPYAKDKNGRGPAWSNSLFEDNAEFGLGMRLAVDQHKRYARELLKRLSADLPQQLVNDILYAAQDSDVAIKAQRERIEELRRRLPDIKSADARNLELLTDYLVDKLVFIIGGDGWAYDIGYGGLDHVLASGRNINIMVLDTEVYSNTGGQASKSTPLGATAKFAADGKTRPKKDLGMIAMSYGNVYVASIAMGAKDAQTIKAMQDAASYDGVSLIIAYSHCIAHGFDMTTGLDRQKQAVQSGYWPLYRYDPRKLGTEESPLELDSGDPTETLGAFMDGETRFKITERHDPEHYKQLLAEADLFAKRRRAILKRMAGQDAAE
ncbi:MAG: thiamine pyrophosphate-dependent enzyme, partial [Rhodospirillaceae bacterium]|nr:thiamine pyrophosphate-dependent enzyme [Rhodospirillaceae bacterium]